MKKLLLVTAAILVLFGCQKQDVNEQIADKWNGYEKFYKAGEVYKDIIVGRNTVAGTMTYGIDDNANFYATFAPNSNYQLEETFLYAGTWRDMPKSKDGDPKMSRFPLHTIHSPLADTYTYLIPLVDLPPCEYPGFVVSAYAELQSTDKCGTKTPSWGKWDRRHEDKTSGGYFTYYYNAPAEPHRLFYVRKFDGCGHRDTYLFDRDDDNHERRCTKISSEDVDPDITYVGVEKDPNPNSTNVLQVVNPADGSAPQLWVDPMDGTPMYQASGTLQAGTVVQSATILGSDYYYIDASTQDIYQVAFGLNESGIVEINSVANVGTVPSSLTNFTINDIAMISDGSDKIMTVIGNSSTDPNVATIYNLTIPGSGDITVSDAIAVQFENPTYGTPAANSTISYDGDGNFYITSSVGTSTTTLLGVNPVSSGTNDGTEIVIGGGGIGGIVIGSL